MKEEGVYLLASLGLASVGQGLWHMDVRGFSALQQQDEGFEAAQPVAFGSRHGHDDASQQAVCHILAVGLEEVWPVLAYIGYQLVSLLLHGLISFLHHTCRA